MWDFCLVKTQHDDHTIKLHCKRSGQSILMMRITTLWKLTFICRHGKSLDLSEDQKLYRLKFSYHSGLSQLIL